MPYLADTLSFLRILLAPVVLLFAVTGEWKTAWAALVVGWATDLLDGPAGRRYGSLRDRHPGLDMDGIADSALAFASAAVPVIYSARHRGWFDLITIGLITLYVITVLSALKMIAIMGKETTRGTRGIIAVNMIVMHGLLQIVGVVVWVTYMAFGFGPVTAIVTGAIMCLPVIQWDKISLWWKGRLA